MRTFIINLKVSTDRKQYMINEMKKTDLKYDFRIPPVVLNHKS